MNTAISTHPWSDDSLFNKAKRYVEQMESESESWVAGLWSALSLELLARAALAHISPVLLAHGGDWHNLHYALGRDPISRKFHPRSIPATELLKRTHELIQEFTDEHRRFCERQSDRRNTELHTGELAFARDSDWRPMFYQVCKVLVESMDRSLIDLVSDSKTACKMLETLKDTAAESVRQDIKAYRKVWSKKPADEKEQAAIEAAKLSTSDKGHRVECPACGSKALVRGEPFGPVETIIDDDDEIVVRQGMMPASFGCTACGLKIVGLSRLAECELGDTFRSTEKYPVEEYYADYLRDYVSDYGYHMEEDMNE